jgi:hypothetical protein
LDDLLTCLFLSGWSCVDSPPEELRVLFHQVSGDRQRRREKYGEKCPRLPVIKRPRGNKQQRGHDKKKKQESAERF